MAKRPAESLVAGIDSVLKRKDRLRRGFPDYLLTKRTLNRWRALAESIDARFRQDGSKLSKRPARKSAP
ncbi:MAG: hypothetical protein H0U59_13850 [Gemmatimonadaceae bacterium]|nr:hypothetical protein [Gemmatimonadaceae bacterium]